MGGMIETFAVAAAVQLIVRRMTSLYFHQVAATMNWGRRRILVLSYLYNHKMKSKVFQVSHVGEAELT